ncbi:MAG: undecaprenyl-diphosphate phosphatase [Planctomycetota bacterium]
MNLLDAIILGLVEGITEYLPVSSTGHLIIASSLLGLDQPPEMKRAVDAFNIVIQGGAILAVLGLYWPRCMQMLRGVLGKDAKGRRLFFNLVIAFLPAAFLGLLLDDWIESILFRPVPVILALALGGVYMMLVDRWRKKHGQGARSITDLTWRQALLIGCFQVLAMWPGTSRSMMTITGGIFAGLRPREAAEFSFLLGLPTLGGACVYKLAKNLHESNQEGVPNLFETLGWAPVIVGVVVATISAALAVSWLVNFLTRHGLTPFGWYRLALAAVLGGLMLGGVVNLNPPSETPPPPAITESTADTDTPVNTDTGEGAETTPARQESTDAPSD